MEIIVDDILEDILSKKEIKCNCDRCIKDIKAITLNNVEPRYVVGDKGIVYNKLNELNTQFRTDVIFQIMSAIEIVEKNPNHDQ